MIDALGVPRNTALAQNADPAFFDLGLWVSPVGAVAAGPLVGLGLFAFWWAVVLVSRYTSLGVIEFQATACGMMNILTGSNEACAVTLEAAQALLAGCDAVFIPAQDGGYALVGLREPQHALFRDMRWSTPSVMEETRLRASAAGLAWRELETLWDLDVPDDLARLSVSQRTCLRLAA